MGSRRREAGCHPSRFGVLQLPHLPPPQSTTPTAVSRAPSIDGSQHMATQTWETHGCMRPLPAACLPPGDHPASGLVALYATSGESILSAHFIGFARPLCLLSGGGIAATLSPGARTAPMGVAFQVLTSLPLLTLLLGPHPCT